MIAGGRTVNLDEEPLPPLPDDRPEANGNGGGGGYQVVVDRLAVGKTAENRVRDSLETAFRHGNGRCSAWAG